MSDLDNTVQDLCLHCMDLTIHDYEERVGATVSICRSCGLQTDIWFHDDEDEDDSP